MACSIPLRPPVLTATKVVRSPSNTKGQMRKAEVAHPSLPLDLLVVLEFVELLLLIVKRIDRFDQVFHSFRDECKLWFEGTAN